MKIYDESLRARKAALKEWLERYLPLVLAMATFVALIGVILTFRLPSTGRKIMVGCVLVGSKSDGGWSESHYKGLLGACQKLAEEASKESPAHRSNGPTIGNLVARDNVPERETELIAAVDELVREGCSIVFLTSFGYGQYMDEIAKSHPRVAFFGVSGEGTAQNCTSYFARLYQVRYLTGIVAGMESRTGIVGYVAGIPNPQTIRNINAYALGMRAVKPQARLIVRFTGSWEDEQAERESVVLLHAEGADVVTYHAARPYVVETAEELQMFSIGYDTVRENYSERFLTAALYNWGVVYGKVLGDYMSGRTNFSRSYWLSLWNGAAGLHPLSAAVSPQTRVAVEVAESQFAREDWDVFSGRIYDNEGGLRCDRDERISDAELFMRMDWFVEGVEIYE